MHHNMVRTNTSVRVGQTYLANEKSGFKSFEYVLVYDLWSGIHINVRTVQRYSAYTGAMWKCNYQWLHSIMCMCIWYIRLLLYIYLFYTMRHNRVWANITSSTTVLLSGTTSWYSLSVVCATVQWQWLTQVFCHPRKCRKKAQESFFPLNGLHSDWLGTLWADCGLARSSWWTLQVLFTIDWLYYARVKQTNKSVIQSLSSYWYEHDNKNFYLHQLAYSNKTTEKYCIQ